MDQILTTMILTHHYRNIRRYQSATINGKINFKAAMAHHGEKLSSFLFLLKYHKGN